MILKHETDRLVAKARQLPFVEVTGLAPTDGDAARGVKSNEQCIFDYLGQVQKVLEDHADLLDNADTSEELLRRRVDHQALMVSNMEVTLARADAEANAVLEAKHAKLKDKPAWDEPQSSGHHATPAPMSEETQKLEQGFKCQSPWDVCLDS